MNSSDDIEKTHSPVTHSIAESPSSEEIDLDKEGEREGYVLDVKDVHSSKDLKLAQDGHTVLIPQPSDDPRDPLNWTDYKKHLILFVISACSFLPDYGSATGAVTLLIQAKAYGVTQDTLNHASSANQFMIGAGGPIAVGLSAYFGRLPVLFWWMVVAVASAAGNAGAKEYEGFLTTRVLNGFFATVAQGGGLMFIKDMFFFHEHARKINIWQSSVIVSPFLGPLFAAFMITKLQWYWPFIVYTIETTLCLVLVMIFVDETFYDRRIPISQQPPRNSRLLRLVGVEQWRSRRQRNTLFQAMMRPVKAISKPVILMTNAYYLLTFAWSVGINATLAQFLPPLYNFGPKQIGFFYFTPIIATILGEITGHWLHDFVAKRYMSRHQGRLEPEARLGVIWIAELFMIPGLILIGFCLQRGYHYMLTALAWGLFSFGIMICSVGVNAYNLDAYPEGSGEVAAWINFSRTTGGFVVSYFQVRWATEMGPEKSFGIQAAVCAAAFGLIVLLQVYGKRLRVWSGPLHFKTS